MKKIKKRFKGTTVNEIMTSIYMIIAVFGVVIVFPLVLVISLYLDHLTYALLWSMVIGDIMIMFVSVIFTSDMFMNFLLKTIKTHIILIAIGLLVIF